ncbi:MAG: ethanolamine ammonia-lyase subunit EutC [Acidobacteriota bacterium]|nr:ethanolamine ammonia-lyase subunit EutC [Acidobacteriota bacterium]
MKRIGLRSYTPARVGLGRAGNSLTTGDLLDFQLAHARARDAVHAKLEPASLLLPGVLLASAAPDRTTYLRRPDLGRKLNDHSRARLQALDGRNCDAVFVVADGLSALAVHRHAGTLLDTVLPRLRSLGWQIAPLIIAEQARVAIGDDIGQILQARMTIVLIGERPGLSSPDSLGIYLTWDPKPGRSDAERNCISNIRGEGLSYTAAAETLIYLMAQARMLGLSGVRLKPADGTPVPTICQKPDPLH